MKLHNGRVAIDLLPLSAGEGEPLLLLHALGGRTTDWDEEAIAAWPGPVHGLDFAGHGRSGWSTGGYYPEFYLADADLALQALGDRATLAGAGVGAYVALLLAGARPNAIRAALLMPGLGLAGGGDAPNYDDRLIKSIADYDDQVESDALSYAPGTDPIVSTCQHDLRPVDYVSAYAAAAGSIFLSGVVGSEIEEPSWWKAVRTAGSCSEAPAEIVAAISMLARLSGR